MGRTRILLGTGGVFAAVPAVAVDAAVSPFVVLLALFTLLPYVVLAAHASTLPPRLMWTLYALLTGAGGWIVADVATDTSSTAALGLLWLPVAGILVAALLTLVCVAVQRTAPTP